MTIETFRNAELHYEDRDFLIFDVCHAIENAIHNEQPITTFELAETLLQPMEVCLVDYETGAVYRHKSIGNRAEQFRAGRLFSVPPS